MPEPIWVTVHTPVGKPNVVAGPFASFIQATAVTLDFDFESITYHHSMQAALADDSKPVFSSPAS